MIDVAKVLEDAADQILVRGWHRGEFASPEGGVCALGAIKCALGIPPGMIPRVGEDVSDHYAAYMQTRRTLARQVCAPSTVTDWNDVVAEDEWEVMDAMRQAAKDIRNGDISVEGNI